MQPDEDCDYERSIELNAIASFEGPESKRVLLCCGAKLFRILG